MGSIAIYPTPDVQVLLIPNCLLPALAEVLRRGMASEHGQPQELYEFVDCFTQLNGIPDPKITV